MCSIGCEITKIVLIAIASSTLLWVSGAVYVWARRKRIQAQQPASIELDAKDAIAVWSTIYEQSADSYRDLVRVMVNTNIAGLAGTAALLASKEWQGSSHLSWALGLFAFGLIFTLFPISGISELYSDHLSNNLREMERSKTPRIQLPHAWPGGIRYYTTLAAFALVSAGAIALCWGIYQGISSTNTTETQRQPSSTPTPPGT